MRKLFPKAEKIPAGIANAADRKLSHSGRLKTGKLNRDQYKKELVQVKKVIQASLIVRESTGRDK